MTIGSVTLNPGTGGDQILTDTVSTVDGAAGPASTEVQVVKTAFGVAGDVKLVSSNNHLPVQLASLTYPLSTNNSSTAQIAPGSSFTGIIEDISNLQAAQVEILCDQPYSFTINQYIDSAGTQISSSDTKYFNAGEALNTNIQLPGNFFNIIIKNTGTATTTTFVLNTTFGIMNTGPRMLGQTSRNESLPVNLADAMVQVVPDAYGLDTASIYDFSGVHASDIVTSEKASNGQSFTAISIDPTVEDHTSTVLMKQPFTIPNRVEMEASISQRVRGVYATLDVFSNDASGPLADSAAIALTSIQQATTTLTMVLATPYVGDIGDWVSIYGVVDNRLNYNNLCIATISADKLTLTATTDNEVTIASLTVGPYASQGFVKRDDQLSGSQNGVRLRFSGTSATSAALLTRFGGNSIMSINGSNIASQLATISSSVPVYTNVGNGLGEIKPTSRYQISVEPEVVVLADKLIDNTNPYTGRVIRTDVKPAFQKRYSLRLRTDAPLSITRPIAKIVSAVKAAANSTATITTAAAHGLVTGNYVTLNGARDVTNYANATTPVAVTVLNSTQFTVTWGTAAIATSYGGMVSLANGSISQPGLAAPVIQTAARDANGYVTIVGSATWIGSGFNVGDYVQVYGCRNSTDGGDVGIDGAYKVFHINTTTAILAPITDYTGTLRSPTGGVITTTNCGGVVIHRTTIRSHDISVVTYGQNEVKVYGQGTTRVDLALPVSIVSAPTITVTGTTNQGTRGTVGAGWYVAPDNVLTADIAAAAFTTAGLTNGSTITPTPVGGASEFNLVVTTVSGTSPTMDVVIQESDDSGTNWYDIYHFPRIISGSQVLRSPVLPLSGNRLRWQRTLGGTTPSFTVAHNRITHTSVTPPVYRQIYDRAVVTTTLNAATATLLSNAANNVQIVVNMGAITTTAPAFQLQGSDDNGASWYSIGTPLTAVASSTVQLTVTNINAHMVRAIISTAGVGSTLGYVLLKAYGV